MLDFSALAEPVTAGQPCGPDLAYDPAFLELERLAAGVPERRMGAAMRPAMAPDWAVVSARGAALMRRSKDWRVALLLVRAAWHLDGWGGLERGLSLLLALEERFGSGVHPTPDDDDPGGWWASLEVEDVPRMPGTQHPLLGDLQQCAIGVPPQLVLLGDIAHDRVDWWTLQDVLDAQLDAQPRLGEQVDACSSITDHLLSAVQRRLGYERVHFAWSHLHRLLVKLGDLLRERQHMRSSTVDEPGPEAQSNATEFDAAEPPEVVTRPRSSPPPATPDLDIVSLLGAIESDDGPCGPDLEYDFDFLELDRRQLGGPQPTFGAVVLQPPDWVDLHDRAMALLKRSKDLRVASILARAATRSNGLRGAAQGLELIFGLVEQWWSGDLHPQVDRSDNDATMRLSAIAGLAHPNGLLGDLRWLEIGEADGVVWASQIEEALSRRGRQPGPQGRAVLLSTIAAQVIADPSFERTLDTALASVHNIDAVIADIAPGSQPLAPLADFLACLARLVQAARTGHWPESEPAPALAPAPAVQPQPLRMLEGDDRQRAVALLQRIGVRLAADQPSVRAD